MRDDLCHPILSGNKARKLYHYLVHDYPQIKHVVSLGGNQSNFMLALAQLASLKQWKMDYWCKPLPKILCDNPNGNYLKSIELGIHFKTTTELDLENIKTQYDDHSTILFFDQGARMPTARDGFVDLANTLLSQYSHGTVFLPSGTGASALYLHLALKGSHLQVYTTPCIGNTKYLIDQWKMLEPNISDLPQMICPITPHRFGTLSQQTLETYQKLLTESGIEFDLLYDPIGWQTLERHYHSLPQPIIYIHCGGTSGNGSMLARYRHAKIL